jgi:hypothetical protein
MKHQDQRGEEEDLIELADRDDSDLLHYDAKGLVSDGKVETPTRKQLK